MSEIAAPASAMPVAVGSNPFSGKTALALVLFGTLVFVVLLWMIGNGLAHGDANDGGAHAEGKGLNGYAAFADLVERGGHAVRTSRSDSAFEQPGLLVLTPPTHAEGLKIDRAVARHRDLGPTLVIAPKWAAMPAKELEARKGWVRLIGPGAPNWPGFLDDVSLRFEAGDKGKPVFWHTRAIRGGFPDPRVTVAGQGLNLVPLVTGERGEIYAAYLNDGDFPALRAMAPRDATPTAADGDAPYPLILVFDPDLLNNYGMARLPSARFGTALVRATAGADGPVVFDLTLNGLERDDNLLTLAFTPPFLAATLCLLLAAAAVGWRAFLRFGPPLVPGRAIAFGKRALVANAAGLIVRSRRLHLLGQPYADAARQRLSRAFALPRGVDEAADLTALDRAARAQGAGDHAFTQAAARVRNARSERELVKAAQDLHALERTLNR